MWDWIVCALKEKYLPYTFLHKHIFIDAEIARLIFLTKVTGNHMYFSYYLTGTCKLRNEKKRKKTKRNGTKKNVKKRKQKETKRKEKKRNENKRNETKTKRNEKEKKRNENKRNETKTKRNEINSENK